MTQTFMARLSGALVMTLNFPLAFDAPEDSRFPLPITVSADGPVTLPPADPLPPDVEEDAPQAAPTKAKAKKGKAK